MQIFEEKAEKGEKSIILTDEFLGVTNPAELNALQYVLTKQLLSYKETLVVGTTHEPSLSQYLLQNPRVQMNEVVIIRHPDGSYTPRVKVKKGGQNSERVGIDLFESRGI